MRLIRGELSNFRQHAGLELNVEGNLIGVVGPNGRGKSNLLGSIQWALTGEIPNVTKDKMLRWGAESGYARWDFEHEGQMIEIQRGINAPTWVRVDGGKQISGITKVNNVLFDIAGLDKDIGRMIFVHQAMLDQVLFDLPSKRQQAFQRLCGMGDANNIYRSLGQFITTRLPDVPDYTEQIAELLRADTELQKNVEELQNQLAALEHTVPDVQKEILQSRVTEADIALPSLAQLSTNLQSVADSEKRKVALETRRQALVAENADTPLDKIDEQIALVTDLITKAQSYQRIAEQAAEAEQAVSTLSAPPGSDEQLAQLEAEYETMSRAYEAAKGRTGLYNELLGAFKQVDDASECPMCGSTDFDRDSAAARMQEAIKQADSEASKAAEPQAEALKALRSMRSAQQEYDTEKTAAQTRLQSAQDLLNATEQVQVDIASKQAEVESMRTIRQEVSKAQTELHTVVGQLSAVEGQHTEAQAQVERAITHLQKFLTDKQVDTSVLNTQEGVEKYQAEMQELKKDAQAELERWQSHSMQVAQIEGQLEQIDKARKRNEINRQNLEHKRDQEGIYGEVRDVLDDVRSFFHYNEGPHRLSVSILNEMNQDVNMFLRQLNAPYSVVAHDTGLTYMCQFHDGRNMPPEGYIEASELSGGEKVLLAVSFRLASYMMFAGKMGLLSLDEPTAYLDDNNISNFCELLTGLKDVAKQLNLQLIMSTHERATIPFMDSVIDLAHIEEPIETEDAELKSA